MMKILLSQFKKNVSNKLANIKKQTQTFKKKVEEAKTKPKSKRKALFLGFTTVVSIFGVTLLTPVLSAVAKDPPKNNAPKPVPSGVSPSSPINQPATVPSEEIIKALAGTAATVCSLAISSGSFVIGAVCGVVVVVGILKTQGK